MCRTLAMFTMNERWMRTNPCSEKRFTSSPNGRTSTSGAAFRVRIRLSPPSASTSYTSCGSTEVRLPSGWRSNTLVGMIMSPAYRTSRRHALQRPLMRPGRPSCAATALHGAPTPSQIGSRSRLRSETPQRGAGHLFPAIGYLADGLWPSSSCEVRGTWHRPRWHRSPEIVPLPRPLCAPLCVLCVSAVPFRAFFSPLAPWW
jgi:hypothetical protein